MWFQIIIAMVAFAANSVLCRLALSNQLIDPMSFSFIRVCSGALMLVILYLCSQKKSPIVWNIKHGGYLALYIVAFSMAYLHVDAGVGALLLFGTVQLTMLAYALMQGERLNLLGSIGIGLALVGLMLLLLPGASAPPLLYAAMMVLSGMAWAGYSIAGKTMQDPLASTLANFVIAIPCVLLAAIAFYPQSFLEWKGVILAVLSGAFASSGAYVLWYMIVKKIDRITASSVQLSVPCLAMFGGSWIIGEQITLQILMATLMVLGGIILLIRAKT